MARFVSSECEIYYDDEGSGRPIIFIHGLWLTSRFFSKQRTFFAEHHRFIAPDLRAHGRSEKLLHGNTVPGQTRDLAELIQALDLRDAVLVGWSSGAFNVWEYLQTYGADRVAGIVVVDESASDYAWPDWPHGPADITRLQAMTASVQTDQSGMVRGSFVHSLFADEAPAAAVDWMVEEITMIPPTIAAAVAFYELTRDYRELLADIKVPALICQGRQDKMIPVGAAEHLAATIPDARLVLFDNSGHAPFYEEPDRFNAELAAFVDELPSR
jgi:non-heme chloroperoxidase